MRDVMKVAIVLLGIAVAAPGYAQEPVSTEGAVVVGDPLGEQKVVCKKQKATGTRFEKKTCMTSRQWDAVREQNRRDAKELIDRPEINNNRG
jgi:hypothetical protein